jgi:hypothetical protein
LTRDEARIVALRMATWAAHCAEHLDCGQRGAMQTYDTLVELARICFKQAREAKNPIVSTELTYLAKGYQMRAASMNSGKLPDIGEEGTAP